MLNNLDLGYSARRNLLNILHHYEQIDDEEYEREMRYVDQAQEDGEYIPNNYDYPQFPMKIMCKIVDKSTTPWVPVCD